MTTGDLARLDQAILSLVRFRRVLFEQYMTDHFDRTLSGKIDQCVAMERLLGETGDFDGRG